MNVSVLPELVKKFEKFAKPIKTSKSGFRYMTYINTFYNNEPRDYRIIVNNKYIVSKPSKSITFEELDKYFIEHYGEEIKDVKVIYFFDPIEKLNENTILDFDWIVFTN